MKKQNRNVFKFVYQSLRTKREHGGIKQVCTCCKSHKGFRISRMMSDIK